MRLTKEMRAEFVADVMDGMPMAHLYSHGDVVQEIRVAIEAQLPEDVLAFVNAYPNLVRRELYIPLEQLTRQGRKEVATGKWVSHSSSSYVYVVDHPQATLVDCTAWKAQLVAYEKELDDRDAIARRLTEVAAACGTLKALQAAFPELVSYVPEEQTTTKNLPVAAESLVSDMLKQGLKVPKPGAQA